MPGKMDDNLRRGNNSENLGLHLLRAVGAVAPVPRDQDVGIDAVVTLLKRDDGRRLIAGSNVFVQLKSSSLRKLVFDEGDIDWLLRLELPYFIGSVDQTQSSIALYTVQSLVNLGSSIRAELYLDEAKVGLNTVDSEAEFNEWNNLKTSIRDSRLSLGPPILEWGIEDVGSHEFLKASHDVLQSWVNLIHENRLLAACPDTHSDLVFVGEMSYYEFS
jgi:hypothetical protein